MCWGLGFNLIFLSDVVPQLFLLGLTIGLGGWSPAPTAGSPCIIVVGLTICVPPNRGGLAGISLRTLGLHEMLLINQNFS